MKKYRCVRICAWRRQPLDKLFVQHGGRIDQHIAVIAADCTDQAIRAGSIGFAHGIEKVLLRKGDFEGIEPLEADFFAKTVDACLGGIRILRNGGNCACDNGVGIVDDILRDLVFTDRKALLHSDNF